MNYFSGCKSLDELKKEYRRLALLHHPDMGGDAVTMQTINAEYDAIFPVLKLAYNQAAKTPTNETAESTRNEFYTQNGWKGDNYAAGLSLKEIAQRVRAFIKEKFPTYKFSVRCSYASMCQELHVEMREAPCKIYKDIDELTDEDIDDIIRRAGHNNVWRLTCWSPEEARAEIARIWAEKGNWYMIPAEQIKAAAKAVDGFVRSYNYSDCDGMIDYFDVNFYYFGCLQDNARNVKHVPRAARIVSKQAKVQGNAPAVVNALRVEINPDFNGVEVYFPSKPSENVRNALKVNSWRWHRKKGCWYNRNTEDNLQGLRAITDPT